MPIKYYCDNCDRVHSLDSKVGPFHIKYIKNRNRIIRVMVSKKASVQETNRMLLSVGYPLLTKQEKNQIQIEKNIYYRKNVKIRMKQVIKPKYSTMGRKGYKPDTYIKSIMKNFNKLPPIDVVRHGKTAHGMQLYKIADGFHRHEAAWNLEKKTIYVNILKKFPEPDHLYWESEPL